MKAVRIHAFGGPEVVTYEDIPQPIPKAHEVLLKVTSSCVNYADVQWRLGNYVDRTLPATLGREAAGIIEAVGPGVTTLQVGQPIMARAIGGNAEYAIAHVQNVFPCPTGLDMQQAGGYPLSFSLLIIYCDHSKPCSRVTRCWCRRPPQAWARC